MKEYIYKVTPVIEQKTSIEGASLFIPNNKIYLFKGRPTQEQIKKIKEEEKVEKILVENSSDNSYDIY